MNAVDTNILLYVHDPRDPRKQQIAQQVVAEMTNGVLLWQVAGEYLAASHKLQTFGLTREIAASTIAGLREVWQIALPSWEVLDDALELIGEHSLSYWDAQLVAAAGRAGVQQLFSEDLTAYPELNGVRLINPFVHS